MARTLNRLTASKVATAKGPRTVADGGRLYLSIDANHNRRWLFIYARHGRQREISLGTFPALSLADARKKRDAYNAALERGEQLAGPRQQGAETFGAVAALVIKRKQASWRGGESARHWQITLKAHCPRLLDRPIASITQEDVLRTLTPLSERASSFASITQSRIAEVFDYARACGLVSKDRPNPAERGVLKFLLPKRKQAVNRPALHYSDVPALIAELRAVPLADSRVVAARALEFVILTALRAGEACNAVSAEFDFDKRLFTVPAERMKSGKEHVLPLCERGTEIVAELAPLRGDDGIVFTAQRRAGAIGSERLLKLLKSLRPGCSVHGFRSSFRDWCGDRTHFPREVAEAALAHVVGGVEGAYRRGNALEKRRDLMEAWSRYCGGEDQQGAKVIALRGL